MKKTSVLIVDPQYLTRNGLFHLLDNLDDLNIEMKEDVNLDEDYSSYDVIITDYLEPYTTQVKEELKENLLEKYTDRLLIISADQNKPRIKELINKGAPGYLTKDCTPDEILSAVEMIAQGNRFYCNKVLELLTHVEGNDPDDCIPTNLSAREVEILKLIATGYSTARISESLHISIHTVNSHRKNILKKLKLSSPTQLVAYAHEIGLV
ncbi:MAG: response regulator transcription factor [Bacteroidota bacterium]